MTLGGRPAVLPRVAHCRTTLTGTRVDDNGVAGHASCRSTLGTKMTSTVVAVLANRTREGRALAGCSSDLGGATGHTRRGCRCFGSIVAASFIAVLADYTLVGRGGGRALAGCSSNRRGATGHARRRRCSGTLGAHFIDSCMITRRRQYAVHHSWGWSVVVTVTILGTNVS